MTRRTHRGIVRTILASALLATSCGSACHNDSSRIEARHFRKELHTRWRFIPPSSTGWGIVIQRMWLCGDDLLLSWTAFPPQPRNPSESRGLAPIGHLAAIASETGVVRWSIETGPGVCAHGTSEDSTFYGVMWASGPEAWEVWSISLRDGSVEWKRHLGRWSRMPLAVGAKALFLNPTVGRGGPSDLEATDRSDGDVIWSRPFPTEVTGVVPRDSHLYLGLYGGPLLSLRSTDATTVWSDKQVACIGAPMLLEDSLVVEGKAGVYCIGPGDGRTIWVHAADRPRIIGGWKDPIPAVVYATDHPDSVSALRLTDGYHIWAWKPPRRLPQAQAVTYYALESTASLVCVLSERTTSTVFRISARDGASTALGVIEGRVALDVLTRDETAFLAIELRSIVALDLRRPRETPVTHD